MMTLRSELHETLQVLNVKQYVLMGHSIAGIYTLDYMNRYKDEVDTFIGIDTSTPKQGGSAQNMSGMLSIFGNLGLYRAALFVKSDLLEYPPITLEQKKEFKKISLKNMGNETVLNEAKQMASNFEASKQLSYPKVASVLFILANESVENKTAGDWYKLHKEMLTEIKNGKIELLTGSHYLHHTQLEKIVELTEQFLSQ